MNNIFGGNSNLPPGYRVSDIPGNRPEDEAWEIIYDNFWNKERIKNRKYGIPISDKESKAMDALYSDPQYSEAVDAYISMAIEYGMEIGTKEAIENKNCDNGQYVSWIQDKIYNKLGIGIDAKPINNWNDLFICYTQKLTTTFNALDAEAVYQTDCPKCKTNFHYQAFYKDATKKERISFAVCCECKLALSF